MGVEKFKYIQKVNTSAYVILFGLSWHLATSSIGFTGGKKEIS